MFKKFLLMSSLLLTLILGFALVPAPAAHADYCNECGQDPVTAGCVGVNGQYQYIISSKPFSLPNDPSNTWEIRLRSSYSQSSACVNRVWASLVHTRGSNPYLNGDQWQNIEVYGENGFVYDHLFSNQFQSGAYTNMITYSYHYACAQYNGNGISPGKCTP